MKVVQVRKDGDIASGVSVEGFAEYLKMSIEDDAANVEFALKAAAAYVDGIMGMNLVGRTVKLAGEAWGDGRYAIGVPGTYKSVEVKYVNTGGEIKDLALTPGEAWIENSESADDALLAISPDEFPELASDRKDAVRITLQLDAVDVFTALEAMMAHQIGAYFYECRVNEKEPQMTVVEKMAIAFRRF